MMTRLLLLLLLVAAPLRAQLVMSIGGATDTHARYLRWTILERRGPANSVQVADLAIIGPTGAVQPWPAGARVTNPDGTSPVAEGPAMLLDLTATHGTKWLSFGFGPDAAVTGRQTIVIDNGAELPPILGLVWWTADDRPERDPVAWTLDLSADGTHWQRIDSVRVVPTLMRHEGVTRRIPNLIPLPTCDDHPVGFAVVSGGTAYSGSRTERTTVMRGGVCLGVTTLASATRYLAHVRTLAGWRTLTKPYDSRKAAEDAVVAAGGK